MGNTSNRDQWAVRERLMFIERLAWWRGVVNRGDLRDLFGISAAQASADLQGYQELNGTALAYNVKSKRYEARAEMACVMHEPRLEEAVRLFLGESAPLPQPVAAPRPDGRVDVFQPVVRKADAAVERRVFLALDGRKRIGIHYWSVNRSRKTRREIAPHALGHDGYRWHARAWCFENGDYRDFALGRIEEAEWPGESFTPPVPDAAWETVETLVFVPNASLDPDRRKTIEYEYGMVSGKLEMTVRQAMREYFLAHLRIPTVDENGKPRPQHLELG